MANLSIKLFKFKCKHCGQFFIRKAIRGMEFTFICDKCNQKADYKVPLKTKSGENKMLSPDEQFSLFPDLIRGNYDR